MLAVETGIPPSVWADEDDRAITTALKILEEREEAVSRGKGTSAHREPGAGGPKFSG